MEHFIPSPLHFGLAVSPEAQGGGGRGGAHIPHCSCQRCQGWRRSGQALLALCPSRGVTLGKRSPLSEARQSALLPAGQRPTSSLGRLYQGSPSGVSPPTLVLPAGPRRPHLLYMFQKSCRLA